MIVTLTDGKLFWDSELFLGYRMANSRAVSLSSVNELLLQPSSLEQFVPE